MSAHYRITAASGIHKGDREYQQDQLLLLPHPRAQGCILGLIADGMGGKSGGRMASDQVVLSAKQWFERYQPEHDDTISILKNLIEDAHTVIRLTAIASEAEPHSTAAAFILNPDGACHWAHSGDSRIYHFRGSSLVKRSRDHSYVQLLVDRGELTELQARDHPKSNILVSCLGAEEKPDISSHSTLHNMQVGDSLMVCSDGLWHYFTDEELGATLSTLPAREAAEFLLDKARQRGQGRGDNISIIVIRFEQLLEKRKTVGAGGLNIPSIASIKKAEADAGGAKK